jgi:outer membrane receptor for ferrienterochelin and colicins
MALWVLLSLNLVLHAQINLRITDKENGNSVEGALIIITDKAGNPIEHLVTDTKGLVKFNSLNLPIWISVSHLSYLALAHEINSDSDIHLQLEPNSVILNDLVITGQYEPQSARRSVYQVRSISSEQIQSRSATKLQDVLNTELNIRFGQDLATGGSNISLQGLSGQNVKVLVDGVPMVGRQGTDNEININQININSIERVEIVEGPMSVIYGADALAGVINIITKKPDEEKLTISARIHEESVGDEYGFNQGIHNQSLSLGYSKQSFYTHIDFNHNNFSGWQGSAEDRDKEWHPKQQYFASALAGYRKNKLNTYYRIDFLHENIYNPGLFSGIEALDQRYLTNRAMHQLQLSNTISDKVSFNSSIAYTDYSRKVQTVTVNRNTGDERLALGPGLQDEVTFDGLNVRGTFQIGLSDKISLQPGYDINYEKGSGGRILESAAGIADYAAFLSAEIKPNDWISVRPGIRLIKNSVYDAPPITPSLNTKFKINEQHDLRLSYGRGFRAPSVRELYFNFFDASHSIEGNPELLAELSHSLNASWNTQFIFSEKIRFNSVLAAFFNDVENMIGYGVKPGNANITTYLNIEEFKSKGLSWTNRWNYKNVDASVGFSYIGRQNQLTTTADVPDFFWSPEANSSVTYNWVKQNASISLFYKYTGRTQFFLIDPFVPEDDPALGEISAYHWADLSIQKSIFRNSTFSLGLRNLFDVTRINSTVLDVSGVHGGGGARPIGYGRSFFATLTYIL